jgi:hypothetical protein
MKISAGRKPKPYKGMAMEGMIATWYAKNTGKSIAEFRDLVVWGLSTSSAMVPSGSRRLEHASSWDNRKCRSTFVSSVTRVSCLFSHEGASGSTCCGPSRCAS